MSYAQLGRLYPGQYNFIELGLLGAYAEPSNGQYVFNQTATMGAWTTRDANARRSGTQKLGVTLHLLSGAFIEKRQ